MKMNLDEAKEYNEMTSEPVRTSWETKNNVEKSLSDTLKEWEIADKKIEFVKKWVPIALYLAIIIAVVIFLWSKFSTSKSVPSMIYFVICIVTFIIISRLDGFRHDAINIVSDCKETFCEFKESVEILAQKPD